MQQSRSLDYRGSHPSGQANLEPEANAALHPHEFLVQHVAERIGMTEFIALSHEFNLPIDEMRERVFTIGHRLYLTENNNCQGRYILEEADERHAFIEYIERKRNTLIITGILSTIHPLGHVRVVAYQKKAGNIECEIVPRPDCAIALPNTDDLFVPVGFIACVPFKTTTFWLDAQGASSPLALSFGKNAPLNNARKSFGVMGGRFITSPSDHRRLMVTFAHPVNVVKRILARKLS